MASRGDEKADPVESGSRREGGWFMRLRARRVTTW